MKPRRSVAFLSSLVLFILAMNCECDEGGGLETATPRADLFHISTTGDPGTVDLFTPTPGNEEILIDFGLVDVGAQEQRFLFIRNSGDAQLRAWDVQMLDGAAEFSVACFMGGVYGDCPSADGEYLVAESGDSLTFRISYTPTDSGPDQGAFSLQLNASDHKSLTVRLQGEGVSPVIQVCVSDCAGDQEGSACQAAPEICNDQVAPADLELNFADADLVTQVRRRLVLRNQGNKDLNISSCTKASTGNFSQFTVDNNNNEFPATLSAGQEIELFVTYHPDFGGEHSGMVQVISDDVNDPEISVVLIGRGMAPRLCPDPTSLDFGTTEVWVPVTKSFTITNCGLEDLVLHRLDMHPGTSEDFSLLNPPTWPLTLTPAEELVVPVQYLPVEAGLDQGGVDIFSNDPASDQATDLTGTIEIHGASIARACQIVATPQSIDFGGVLQDTVYNLDLIVSNQGTETCTVTDVRIDPNSASDEFMILVAPSPNTDFMPGDTLLIKLQYAPVDLGIDNGVLIISGNDVDTGEIPVELSGEGVDELTCRLEVSPESLQFGTVGLNNTKHMVVQLTNTGHASCLMDPIELYPDPAQNSDFTITGGPSGAFLLDRKGQPDSQREFEITFHPGALDLHRAVVWLHTEDDPSFILGQGSCQKPGNPPQDPGPGDGCLPISGYAAETFLEVVPAELNFGVVTVGCNSPELHVTVYNLGAQTVQIEDIYLESDPDPNFEIMYAPMTPYDLRGGSSFEVRARYHPQDTTIHRSILYVEAGDPYFQILAIPLYGRGTDISEQTDIFHQPDKVKSDVLFVVDNSGSMQEEQDSLAANFDSFIQNTVVLDVDFHIGVISVEVNDTETGMGNPPRVIQPGVLVNAPNRPKILVNNTPNIRQAFTENVSLGTCCADEQEAGLQAAWMALSSPNIDDPAINGGFMREDAKLYIICVSDEQDQSDATIDFYVDFFTALKGYNNPEWVTVSAICGDRVGGCSGSGGMADSGSRYIEAVEQTGGIFESICTSNWAQALYNLGMDAFAAIREFALSRSADPNTITVSVNGTTIPEAGCQGCANGWSFYPLTNSVYFGDDYVPELGDVIEVHYETVCL